MSAAVDVLAVWDEAIADYDSGVDLEFIDSMREARASVAELIDMLRNIEALTSPHSFKDYFTKGSAIETLGMVHQRAVAALARVGRAK